MTSLAAIEKRLDRIAHRRSVSPAVLTPLDVARAAGIDPDPWQADVLRSQARQIILLCSRQAGKSTVSSILATHRAVTAPGSLVLLLAPALRQSQELFRKVKGVYAALEGVAPAVVESALTLELSNGSRIVTLPGKEATVRGFSAPDLVIEDESARVPDELHQAIRPMVAVSGGRLILLSSAFGRRGHFFQFWDRSDVEWHRVMVTAYDVPRIDPAWLEQERAAIGDWWFRQEFGCEFLDTDDQLFSTDLVLAALSSDVATLSLPTFKGAA